MQDMFSPVRRVLLCARSEIRTGQVAAQAERGDGWRHRRRGAVDTTGPAGPAGREQLEDQQVDADAAGFRVGGYGLQRPGMPTAGHELAVEHDIAQRGPRSGDFGESGGHVGAGRVCSCRRSP